MARPPSPEAIENERERIVARLGEHYAHNHIDDAELERRIELAQGIEELAKLSKLESDLPELPRELARGGGSAPSAAGNGSTALAPRQSVHGLAVVNEVPEQDRALTVLGDLNRKGAWTLPRQFESVSVLGLSLIHI